MSSRVVTARNCVAMAAALMTHAGFFYLFAGELRSGRRIVDRAERVTKLILIRPTIRESVKVPSRQAFPRSKGAESREVSEDDGQVDASIASDTRPNTPLAIDLDTTKTAAILATLERERVARQSAFTDRNTKPFIPMPQEIERSGVPWDPLRGRRAGLTDQGLFFVRLSERCVIVTTFLVCSFGRKK